MRTLGGVWGAVLIVIALPAVAQTPAPAFQLDRLELDTSAVGSLTTGSGRTLARDEFRAFAALHYQRHPLWVVVNGVATVPLISDRFSLHLGGAWAVYDRLELFLQVPVVLGQGGKDATAWGYTAPATSGLGSPSLGARYQFLEARKELPLDLAGELALAIPIGSDAALANDPGFGITPRLSAGMDLWELRLSADLGVKVRPTASLGTSTLGPQLDWGLSVARRGLGLRPELAVRSGIGFTDVEPTFDLLTGVRYSLGDFELFLLGGPGLGTAPGTPAFRVVFGGAWHRRRPVAPPPPTCVAGQPHDPAQCPNLDLDGDGVRNAADRCPREAEDQDGYEDADGCPDRDNDGDGLLDAQDKCPNQAGAVSNEGCPVRDTDGDGVLDPDDACPNEAGPADRKGCPVRDADGDGVEDGKDECPKVPGPVELKGCPDQDGDGVADALDNCPTEKGPATNQGCPEKVKQLVVITREKLVIKDKVFFATLKTTIEPRSYALLNQVASVLTSHPELKVRVEGHTDNFGTDALNRRLSDGRAKSVLNYLVKKGVAPERLTAQGFGPDRPAADNATPEGRDANRRVEFVILDQEGAGATPEAPAPDAKPQETP